MEPSFLEKKILSSEETARALGISETSVKNWVRHGFIEALRNDNAFNFRKDDVVALLVRIRSGDLKRLSSRANKSGSSRTFLHQELFINEDIKCKVSEISSVIMRHNMPHSTAMFFLCMNILLKSGMLHRKEAHGLIRSPEIKLRGSYLCDIIRCWRKNLPPVLKPQWADILEYDLPEHNNIAGIIYQSILMEREKSRFGLYYTPEHIVHEIIERVADPGSLFLDPCCGTGDFLLAAAGKAGDPVNVYGIDIDPVAVNIAKINLMIKFSHIEFDPKIYCADFLLHINNTTDPGALMLPAFDCIATNPPWGSHYNKSCLKKLDLFYPEVMSGESFSFFLLNSFRMLKKGGVLSFILPESLLNVKKHRDVRCYLLNNSAIRRIHQKKRIFREVFSNAVVIDIVKDKKNAEVEIVNKKGILKIGQGRFRKNWDYVFDIDVSSEDEKILSKIFSFPHRTLKDNALWALGIVTGNNSRYITKIRALNSEPVITGKDISAFKITGPSSYIIFEPEKFQQTAHVDIYRSPRKLVYKYISRRIIMACDCDSRLTLNSANILIPQLEGVDMKVIMGLFNSTLYQYIFQKKFSSVKILKSHLEILPVPVMSRSTALTILRLVEDIEKGSQAEDILDKYIYGIFRLNKKETESIIAGVK